MSSNPTIRQQFINYSVNIGKLLDAINPIKSIDDEIQTLLDGDCEREENLERFGRENEFDDSVRTALEEALDTFYESGLKELVNNLSELQKNLQSYIGATGK